MPTSLVGKIAESKPLTYLAVGGMTAAIYFGLFALSIEALNLDYRVGVSVSYVAAVSFHFAANRRVTFIAADGELLRQLTRYLGVLVVNYMITLGVVSLLVGRLGTSPYLAATISIVVTVAIGYFASKLWVFRRKEVVRD